MRGSGASHPTDVDVPSDKPQAELQVGGQAVIEGVVMRTADRWALAVRRPGGDMFVTVNPILTIAQKHPRWNKFPLRGIFALADSLIIGVKALSISGGVALEETAQEGDGEAVEQLEEDRPDSETSPHEKETKSIGGLPIAISMLFALVLFLGLFIVFPAWIAKQFDSSVHNVVVYNLIEGGIRIAIFVLYLAAMDLMPDVRRVFQYHGAEHKVVHAYESGEPLTPEAASKFSTAHMRCGTAFLLIVFVLSILVFSFMGRPALWLRVLERLAIIPFVAAFSYEIIKFAGRHEDSRVMKVMMSPGLLLQKLTTRQPDESQLEVAIVSLEAALDASAAAAADG
ncbi:MAG TPA: DUF1385 domain-containing protein [Candidatus Anoxymicrobiaceae bacterium]